MKLLRYSGPRGKGRRMKQPQPPVNITLHMRDGRVIPVDSAYVGEDELGFHAWRVLTVIHAADLEKVTVEVLPPRTTILLQTDEPT